MAGTAAAPVTGLDDRAATSPQPPTSLQRSLAVVVWIALVCAGVVHLAYLASIAGLEDDTEHLETTLSLATATQFRLGPGALYGPYSRHNPWVLVQAPLYYHLTALAAWPLTWLGLHPVRACFISGRILSALASLGCLFVVYRLARLDGTSRRAGGWAALLVASAGVVGAYPITVRPDMLGVFLQSFGVLTVTRALFDRPDRPRGLTIAYAAFALAFCAKQHDVVCAGVSSLLLLAAMFRQPGWRWPVVRAHLVAGAIVASVLGFDELITSGRLSQMAFVQPMKFGSVAASSWFSVLALVLETGARSSGLLALLAACAWALFGRASLRRMDAILLLYLAAEIAVFVALGLNSTGAWLNYAIEAVIFACILVGRGLDRAFAERAPGWRALPLALAAGFLAWSTFSSTRTAVKLRLSYAASVEALLNSPPLRGASKAEIYFVALPQYNRMLGRVDLALDDWLYGCLEKTGAVEPRSQWLRQELTVGRVRLVVVPRHPPIPIPDRKTVPGVDEPLPALGFAPAGDFGQLILWARREGRTGQHALGAGRFATGGNQAGAQRVARRRTIAGGR